MRYSPLLTDLYQLTMAYGYYQLGMHDQNACFHVLFRNNPFKGQYAICAGLGSVVEFLNNWRFLQDDLNYLSTLKNVKREPIFTQSFLDYLQQLKFSCNIDAVCEGVIVFPHEPLLRIEGPLLQCQLLETPLLNMINFQTLIATKASRVCRAAHGESVIEFGMRRAQGPDGALSASRAAYIGGCEATSNTLAGKLYDIPVRGTHAHSFVTAFASEQEAFAAYASVMPHNTVLLVDTYNTLQGVKNAIALGKKLREEGADLLGVRLDSGDLADLSIKARKMLDNAGFENTIIFASNALDEYVIADIKSQGAKITAWGVGTHLVTAYDQPALDGVYKLSALSHRKSDEKNGEEKWDYKLKLSEHEIKINNPGRHQVRRYFSNDTITMDVIYDVTLGIAEVPEPVLVNKAMTKIRLDDYDAYVDLLEPIYKRGKCIQKPRSIHDIRKTAIDEVTQFCEKHGDQIYSVGLESRLSALKNKLVLAIKKNK